MILRSNPASPFGRKVKIVANVLGRADHIAVEFTDTKSPDDTLYEQNPLGKIPVLVLDTGETIYDSSVICAFLAEQAGDAHLFPSGPARWPALTLAALADGVLEAALLQVYEKRFRPEEKWHEPWSDRQQQKLARALRALEANPPVLGNHPHIGHIGLACALGYLDFRFAGDWRDGHPSLVGWLEAFSAKVPAFATTVPHD